MNSTTKISITGAVLITTILSITIAYYSFDEAMAFVATGNIPDEGIIQARQAKGINAGYKGGYGFEPSVMIHISSGNPNNTHEINSAVRGLQNAQALHDAGNNVVVFLDVDGVRIADNNHPESLDTAYASLKSFLNDGGRVIACDLCEESIQVDDLLRGVEIDFVPVMPKLNRILMESDIVLDY
jgi:hypothetical protein